MYDWKILHGDAETMLRTLPDESVHCVVTSPPYWGLRDYGSDDQIGLEETPDEYVARIVAVFREVRRVLRSDGTCWVNLGDSYAGSGRGQNPNGKQGTNRGTLFDPDNSGFVPDGLKPKDIVGIPWRVAFALQSDGWWLRQDIIWHKPNPMPESVRDRCTKAHEYVFLLTKSARYFYDADAVSEAIAESTVNRYQYGWNGVNDDGSNGARTGSAWKKMKAGATMAEAMGNKDGTRNKRSVWSISTKPYAGAHFATMPPELAETCILAGTSAKGRCPLCGAPWERVTERIVGANPSYNGSTFTNGKTKAAREHLAAVGEGERSAATITTGWQPTCTCAAGVGDFADDDRPVTLHTPDPIPCTVLDPFAGSGTTLAVAIANARSAIGIELNAAYIDLANKRITGTQPALFGA